MTGSQNFRSFTIVTHNFWSKTLSFKTNKNRWQLWIVAVQTTWNSLPADARLCQSVTNFPATPKNQSLHA